MTERKNYGCLGCKNCSPVIVEGDQWGYACTDPERCSAILNVLPNGMIYGFTIIIKMDGTIETQMYEKPPKCKREK